MSQNTTFSKRMRFEILRRDNHTCRYCGAKAPDVTLHVDHVIPVALGGTNDPSNGVTACSGCNSGKASISPDSPIVENVAGFVFDFKHMFGQMMDVESDMIFDKRQLQGWFLDLCATHRFNIQAVPAWKRTLATWQEMGVPWVVIEDAFEVMIDSPARRTKRLGTEPSFRYFCGIVWNKVNRAGESAAEALHELANPNPKNEWGALWVDHDKALAALVAVGEAGGTEDSKQAFYAELDRVYGPRAVSYFKRYVPLGFHLGENRRAAMQLKKALYKCGLSSSEPAAVTVEPSPAQSAEVAA